jgi:hypothetical protein
MSTSAAPGPVSLVRQAGKPAPRDLRDFARNAHPVLGHPRHPGRRRHEALTGRSPGGAGSHGAGDRRCDAHIRGCRRETRHGRRRLGEHEDERAQRRRSPRAMVSSGHRDVHLIFKPPSPRLSTASMSGLRQLRRRTQGSAPPEVGISPAYAIGNFRAPWTLESSSGLLRNQQAGRRRWKG